ncbi:hypothetical protein AB4Z54_54480 [Streptomyces sp. MCAF7]
MLHSLKQIYPNVDIASHIIGDPVTISREDDPDFMSAFSEPRSGRPLRRAEAGQAVVAAAH